MIDKPLIIFFIGRSGSGKGTQYQLLKEYLSKIDNREIFAFEMGKAYRDFLAIEKNLGAEVGKHLYDTGKLMPNFITSSFFVTNILLNLKKDQHLFIDGYPRSISQLEELNKLIEYYGFEKNIVLDIDVPEEEVKKRMLLRGRRDDTESAIENRFAYYRTDILPVIEMLKNDSRYQYIKINGLPTPPEIHENIKQSIGI